MPGAHDVVMGACGLVAMTSASHAEGRQFDPGQVYLSLSIRVICVCVCPDVRRRVPRERKRESRSRARVLQLGRLAEIPFLMSDHVAYGREAVSYTHLTLPTILLV